MFIKTLAPKVSIWVETHINGVMLGVMISATQAPKNVWETDFSLERAEQFLIA
jgi:hypothetical protein